MLYAVKDQPHRCYARVQRNGETTNLGSFDDEIKVARARDRKALELLGPYVMLNFPEERDQRLREIEAERVRAKDGQKLEGGGQRTGDGGQSV